MKAFRPDSLDALIGCDDIKETIQVGLVAAKSLNNSFPHSLLYGGPGLGKTTISNIIAKEMGGDLKVYLSNVFKSRQDVQNLMAQLNADNHEDADDNDPERHPSGFKLVGPIKPTIIFLDEIHQLTRKVQECFFEAMEDNKFTVETRNNSSGRAEKKVFWIPKFTLIGATTRAGDLDGPFVERFKLKFTLKLYSEAELATMIAQSANISEIEIKDTAIKNIAKRSRGVARKAINFFERARDTAIYMGSPVIDDAVVNKTFELLHVDQKGFEDTDLQALSYLYKIHPRKIGVARLASVLNVTENILKEIVEPYLLREGLIEATPGGRIISEQGLIYCEKNNLTPQTEMSGISVRRVPNA